MGDGDPGTDPGTGSGDGRRNRWSPARDLGRLDLGRWRRWRWSGRRREWGSQHNGKRVTVTDRGLLCGVSDARETDYERHDAESTAGETGAPAVPRAGRQAAIEFAAQTVPPTTSRLLKIHTYSRSSPIE